jgi:hypothetical protein
MSRSPRGRPVLTGRPLCQPYRHARYLTPTGLYASFLLTTVIPTALIAVAMPGVAAAVLLGLVAVIARIGLQRQRVGT